MSSLVFLGIDSARAFCTSSSVFGAANLVCCASEHALTCSVAFPVLGWVWSLVALVLVVAASVELVLEVELETGREASVVISLEQHPHSWYSNPKQ